MEPRVVGWLTCDRCGGKKVANYTPLCEECKFEDVAKRMLVEMDEWLLTGDLPLESRTPATLPRPERDEPVRHANPLDTDQINGD
jgi:hypothetical protein